MKVASQNTDHATLTSIGQTYKKNLSFNLTSCGLSQLWKTVGIELLTEELYRSLQQHGPFDQKTSSWITTPDDIRKLGGALFGDHRYGRTFTYHNGAESYYAARGFRSFLRL